MPGKLFPRVVVGLTVLLAAPALAQDALNTAEVCAAKPMVDSYGSLTWGETHLEGQPMPYNLTCEGLQITTSGKRVVVKAGTIQEALAVFTEESFFLSYFADLRIRYDGAGHLSADPVRDVSNSMLDEVFRIKVTVTPRHGQPHELLKNAMPYPLTLPADQAFTIDIDTGDLPNPWPHIEIDPARGQIAATLGEQQ